MFVQVSASSRRSSYTVDGGTETLNASEFRMHVRITEVVLCILASLDLIMSSAQLWHWPWSGLGGTATLSSHVLFMYIFAMHFVSRSALVSLLG